MSPAVTSDVGTFAYMAPEQRLSRYNNKVDIYALGMLLWEMFELHDDREERHSALMRTRRTGKVGWWCRLKTPESTDLIEKLIQLNPAKRPTAIELLNSLDAAEL